MGKTTSQSSFAYVRSHLLQAQKWFIFCNNMQMAQLVGVTFPVYNNHRHGIFRGKEIGWNTIGIDRNFHPSKKGEDFVKRLKRWQKKAGAFLLAAMLMTSAFPVSAAASEKTEPKTEITSGEQDSNHQEADRQKTEANQTEENSQKDQAGQTEGGSQKNVTGENKEKNQNAESGQTNETAQPAETSLKAQEQQTEKPGLKTEANQAENNSLKVEQRQNKVLSAARAVDVTGPVIENVEFIQGGQHLTQEDTLKLSVKAYDTESDIASVTANIRLENEADDYFYITMTLTESGEQTYTGQLPLKGQNYTKGCIESIEVVDTPGNITTKSLYEDKEKYSFTLEAPENPVAVETMELSHKHQTVNFGESITFTITLNQEYEKGNTAYITFQGPEGTGFSFPAEKTGEVTYEGSASLSSNMKTGNWMLSSIELVDENGDNALKISIENMSDYWFIVENTLEDQEPPVLQEFSMNIKNGQTLNPGDKITFTVKATDDSPLRNQAQIMFQSAMDNLTAESSWRSVMAQWDEQEGLYRGTLELDQDMYPSEWYVQDIILWDENNMMGEYTGEKLGDYYFYLQREDTLVTPTYSVSISFLQLDKNGYWNTSYSFNQAEVARRTTLKDLGVIYPEMASPLEEMSQTGWKVQSWSDTPIECPDLEAPILSDINYVIYAVYDKECVRFTYTYQNENGNTQVGSVPVIVESGTTYGDLEEILADKVIVGNGYQGAAFTGWNIDLQGHTADEVVTDVGYVYGTARYEQIKIAANYSYLSKDGSWVDSTKEWVGKPETTIDELQRELSAYVPENGSEEYSIIWTFLENYEAGATVEALTNYSIYLEASYSGKKIVQHQAFYWDEDGAYSDCGQTYIVDEGTTYEEVDAMIQKEPLPEFYPGLRFSEWDNWSGNRTGVIEDNYSNIYEEAIYENSLVRFIVDQRCRNMEYPSYAYDLPAPYDAYACQVAEPGESVTIPDTVENCSDITWIFPSGESGALQSGDSITISNAGMFVVAGYSNSENPGETEEPDDTEPDNPGETEEPDDTQEPDNPGEPDDSDAPETPGNTQLPEETVNQIVEQIKNAGTGETVVVTMKDATVIPKEILESAKGKDVNLYLEMGGYSWTINGKDVLASNLQDIDLRVEMNTGAVPPQVVQQMAGENPSIQLSLDHEGDFGFKAVLNLYVGSQYAGKYGNLFYYDSAGKMVYISTGLIGADGRVSLNFSHASDYLVVIDDTEMSQEDVPKELTPSINTSPEQGEPSQKGQAVEKKDKDKEKKASPKTGDTAQTGLYLVLAVGAAAGLYIMRRREKAE